MGDKSATSVSAKEMAEVINSPGKKIVYRQTCNWAANRFGLWYTPKKLLPDGQWRTITNTKGIVLPFRAGATLALWRMWNKINEMKGVDGNMKWTCTPYKVRVGIYTKYYLVCRYNATSQSIHGIF